MYKTPSDLSVPAFLMSFPFTVDNRYINNPLMEIYRGKPYDLPLAFQQFMCLYNYLAKHALVYLLPSEGNFQDQTFVANLGCYLPHTKQTIVLANFKSEPRQGEDEVGYPFFESMGYDIIQPPTTFEGEADLKWVKDNLYVGGYGSRTGYKTYDFIEVITGAEIIRIQMMDKSLYHFDCMFLQLAPHKALVATHVMQEADLKKLEKHFEVLDVPKEHLYNAWTNCLVYENRIFHSPATVEIGHAFEEFMVKKGFEPVIMTLTEFEKSGAALSCMLMHLNYNNRW